MVYKWFNYHWPVFREFIRVKCQQNIEPSSGEINYQDMKFCIFTTKISYSSYVEQKEDKINVINEIFTKEKP